MQPPIEAQPGIVWTSDRSPQLASARLRKKAGGELVLPTSRPPNGALNNAPAKGGRMFHNLLGPLLVAGSVAAIACAEPAQAQIGDEQIYSLPVQDLSISLREVANRSGRNIIAPSELVEDRQAPAISGPFTAEGAVRLLLAGSGLEVRRVGDSLVIARQAALADESRTGEPGELDGAGDDTIVVTGTNIRGGEPTSPLIVLDRGQIDDSGAASVEQLMRRVPQNSQGGINQENFRVAGAGADVTEHGAGLNAAPL